MNSQHDSEERPEEAQKTAQESFGTWLRRQRVVREIELREIAETSKISMRYLSALEEDRFEVLPAVVFAKGFLRQYAKYVGLDPEEVINFFIAARAETEAEVEPNRPRQRPGSASFWTYFGFFLLLAALLLGVVWLLSYLNEANRDGSPAVGRAEAGELAAGHPPGAAAPSQQDGQHEPSGIAVPLANVSGSASDATAGEAPTEPLRTATTALGESPPWLPSSATEAELTSPLRVTLDFTGECWTEAWVDGERRIAEIRVQGESIRLDADREVELKLGDVSVVEIEVNGQAWPVEVIPGTTVRRLRIDLETARDLETVRDLEATQNRSGASPP